MVQSRRDFLRTLPTITVGAALALPAIASAAGGESGKHHWAMVIDVQKCIGCQACTMSCIMENAVPENSFRTFSPTYEVHEGKHTGIYMLPRLLTNIDRCLCVSTDSDGRWISIRLSIHLPDVFKDGVGFCCFFCTLVFATVRNW